MLQQAALVSLVVAHWVKSTRAEMHESHIPFVLIRGWDGSAMIPPLTSIKPAAEGCLEIAFRRLIHEHRYRYDVYPCWCDLSKLAVTCTSLPKHRLLVT